jgi:hypothetical protein
MKLFSILLVLVNIFEGCSQSLPLETSDALPQLKIVELVAKGSVRVNEFGVKSDWLKLNNFGNDTIFLSDYKIYLTDNVARKRKFRLKKKLIAPKSSITVWCDDQAIIKKQIHTNFKLSSFGETISLTIKIGSHIKIIDQVYYNDLGLEGQKLMVRQESNLLKFKKEF